MIKVHLFLDALSWNWYAHCTVAGQFLNRYLNVSCHFFPLCEECSTPTWMSFNLSWMTHTQLILCLICHWHTLYCHRIFTLSHHSICQLITWFCKRITIAWQTCATDTVQVWIHKSLSGSQHTHSQGGAPHCGARQRHQARHFITTW